MAIRHLSRGSDEDRKGLDSTFILDAKLTMVRCFSLFCWAALSSGRLSLLAARSHPQESRHKIKLGFIFMISSSTLPPNLLLDHCHDCALTLSITAATFSGRPCASRKQRQELSMKARHEQTNDVTDYLNGIVLCPCEAQWACYVQCTRLTRRIRELRMNKTLGYVGSCTTQLQKHQLCGYTIQKPWMRPQVCFVLLLIFLREKGLRQDFR